MAYAGTRPTRLVVAGVEVAWPGSPPSAPAKPGPSGTWTELLALLSRLAGATDIAARIDPAMTADDVVAELRRFPIHRLGSLTIEYEGRHRGRIRMA